MVSRATEEDVEALFGSVVAHNARLLSQKTGFFCGYALLNH